MDIMKRALLDFKNCALPTIDAANTLKDCLDFFYFNSAAVLHIFTPDENYGLQYNSGRNNESLLFFKVNDRKDWIAEMELSLLHYKKSLKSKKYSRDEADSSYEAVSRIYEKGRLERVKKRDEIYNDSEMYKKVREEIEKRKKENYDLLKQYNIL